jgi:ribosomal protein S18 acetylase RimI-like enzyme
MRIEPVRGRGDVTRFVRLPWMIYRDDSVWIPPLRADVRKLLDQSRHPFYDQGEGAENQLFLAWEGRDVVGRVAAILNHAHNRYCDENVAFFGFFESIERPDVACDLLAAVEVWAAERGVDAVRGPMNPSTNYECAMLVEGFARSPVLMMTHNPQYYPRLVEAAGYEKVKDLYAYISPVHGTSLDRLERLAARTRRRNPDLVTRDANLKDFVAEVARVREIYNSAWAENWGFVPMSDGEIGWLAQELKPLVHPGLTRFAFMGDDPAGFLLCMPDWNAVLAELDGSPFRHPLRTLKHLLRTRAESLEGLRVILLGVKPQYRNRGIEGILLGEGLRVAVDAGYQWCEYSWILEENELTKRLVRLMDGELYKTYRVYEKPLT